MSRNELQDACNYFMRDYTLIKHNGELYYYNEGIYKPFTKRLRKDIARGYVTENMTDRFKKDVLLNIADNLDEYEGRVNVGSYVAFNDCLFNCDTFEVEPFRSSVVLLQKLQFKYPVNAYEPNIT